MRALLAALTAAPVATWDTAETQLVLDAVNQIVRKRRSNVTVLRS
ncbi:hypothetical protein [Mycobacterium kansasii]|nr:hypothetical protein [Mycobacterium kansasii]